jgi:uncharacterized membrane protein YjjP (DUF1212 family)
MERAREDEDMRLKQMEDAQQAGVTSINISNAHYSTPTLSTLSPTLSRLHQRAKQAHERLEEIRKTKEVNNIIIIISFSLVCPLVHVCYHQNNWFESLLMYIETGGCVAT